MKIVYYTFGCLSLSLGVLGIFLPLLPTTPFLLVASYCFVKSSKKMHEWLISHKVFGEYIKNYIDHKSIRRKDRMIALMFLWTALVISMVISKSSFMNVLLPTVGFLVTIHILSLNLLE